VPKYTIDETAATFIGLNGNRKVYTPDNAKHIFVCGTTGSGKTVVLSNYIQRAVDRDYPLLLVDGKGDVGSSSMLEIVRQLNPPGRKLHVVNLTIPEQSDHYNPFRQTAPTVAKDMLVNLTTWNEEYYKLNAERYLQRLVLLLNKADIPLSLKTIVRYIAARKFTALSAELFKAGVIDKDDHTDNVEIAATSGKVSENSVARFSTIVESELGHIFHEDGIDIYTALQERATILFILNPLIYPELSPLLGRLVLVDAKKAVSKLFVENLGRTFFILDEINVYASNALINLVNKSRSANITCILATQSLSDLASAEDDNFTQQVIENCNNYLVLRQNSAVNSESWANILGTRNTMEVTYQLGQQGGATAETGLGSAKLVREFIYHPDDIKSLPCGKAFFLSRDTGQHCKVAIYKPF
jgi:type IV secretory pathway TraG/TraD family ATPase VirD4